MARGNWQENIFFDEEDYHQYIQLLGKYKEKYGFKLFAFTLMTNHLHLLLEIGHFPLSRIMQGIQQSYTQYFNRRHQKVGHLFQGRYKAILCQKDAYLLELVRYVHLNPIRAKIVDNLLDYPWTSHKAYVSGQEKNTLVNTEFILRQFSRVKYTSQKLYAQFVEAGKSLGYQNKFYLTTEQRMLGNEEFVQEVFSKAKTEEGKPKLSKKLSFDGILELICEGNGREAIMVRSPTKEKKIILLRRLLIYFARFYYQYSLKEIATYLRMDTSSISKNMQVILNSADITMSWKRTVKRIKDKLNECQECQA